MSTSGHTDPHQIKRFEDIYAATYSKLYSFVKRYVRDETSIKDILQDCYIRLWEKIETVTGDEKILPMLRTWVMNITINALRKNARDMHRDAAWQQGREQVIIESDRLVMGEALQRYRRIVEELPRQQRLVFGLTREEGLSQQETADRLQISVYTVKRHLSEAMRTLRTRIPGNTLTGIALILELSIRTHA